MYRRCKVWQYGISTWVSEGLGIVPEERVREGVRVVIVLTVGFLSFGLGLLAHTQNRPHTLVLDDSNRVLYEDNWPSGGSAVLNAGTSGKARNLGAAAGRGTSGKVLGAMTEQANGKTIVASRKGRKYYYIWCKGVERISAKNRRFFATPEDARKGGLAPASNCPGLN
jgi:hypothetical protein